MLPGVIGVEHGVGGLDAERSPVRHRVRCVEGEIHQHLLDLSWIGRGAPMAPGTSPARGPAALAFPAMPTPTPLRLAPGDGPYRAVQDESVQRYAAIDIGSNSIRQIVADVSGAGQIRVVDELKAAPRLGAGPFETNTLADEPMRLALGGGVRGAGVP